MARIKLNIPDHTIATITVPVRITDINYGNHLGNDSLVSILHDSRVQWLRPLGYSELDIEGVGLIMSDLAVEYKNESFQGDVLSIDIAAGDITSVSFELYYSVHNQDGLLIARAKTGMVCYDYGKKKVISIPANFLIHLEK